MKRATITLPDELEEALEAYRRSQELPLPLTALTQAALREYLEKRGFLPPSSGRSFGITPSDVEAGRGTAVQNTTGTWPRPPKVETNGAGQQGASLRRRKPCWTSTTSRAQEEIGRLGLGRLLGRCSLPDVVANATRLSCTSWVPAWRKVGCGEIEGSSFLMNPTPDDFREAAGLMHRYGDQALSMFDAVAAAVSRRLSLPVWTYNHHFDGSDRGVAKRESPQGTSVEIGRSDSRVFPG